MIRCLLAIILLCSFQNNYAQKKADSAFLAYKQTYKDDLFPIIEEDTAYIAFYKYDPRMITVADVKLLKDEPVFKMTTSSGKTKDAQKYALVTFRLKGRTFKLFVYQLLALKSKAETADDLFFPFTDLTCSNGSYGGGRYLDFKEHDIVNGKLTIDFNKAYNPYCAFTTGYNCPIPPRENDITIAIKAGERYQAEKFQH